MSGWGLFIAGTDTAVGKTRVTAGLVRALNAEGVRAIGMKPVASGTDAHGRNEDVLALRAASAPLPQALIDDINPYLFAWPVSPHLAAAREGVTIEPARIQAATARLAAQSDALLVEGTGGWLAPISARASMADIARRLGLPVVLVVGMRLGCLNHALLTARAIVADGLALRGWIASVIDPKMLALQENLQALEERLDAPPLGLLPHLAHDTHDAGHLRAAALALRAQPAPPARAARP